MDGKPPILDYHAPEKAGAKIPFALRLVLGILATSVTLLAALYLGVGIRYLYEIGNCACIFIGLFFAFIAYFLWKPVGLRFLPRRRP
jgi:hypothetical protein